MYAEQNRQTIDLDVSELTTGEKIAAVSGVVTFFAAFLTWVEAGFITVAGTSGDGVFTLVFGAIVVGLVLLREWKTTDMAATGILGLFTLVIAGNVYANLGNQAERAVVQASAGIGLVAAAGYGVLKERNRQETLHSHR